MAYKIAVSTLQASTIDILNTIRANADLEYQNAIPQIETYDQVIGVGDTLLGYPALANKFINSLMNRIALVLIKSATFNNKFAAFKKGYLEFGEVVEEVFVEMCKAQEFNVEKGYQREFKRYLPEVKARFHAINWSVQYPITITRKDLKKAFLSPDGFENLITKILDAPFRGAEYDEYLLFKYLIIKAFTHGKLYPVSIGDGSNMNDAAIQFRGVSNDLQFIHTKYNNAGVHTNTERADQHIFMDSFFNAKFDVNVLADAFNMEKAQFMGMLNLVDSFTSFDNDRFDIIRENTNNSMIEEVTAEELALMADVKAVLADAEWFQVYDVETVMTDKEVASTRSWNYFLNIEKIVDTSEFSNAVAFVTSSATITPPSSITVVVKTKDENDDYYTFSIEVETDEPGISRTSFEFVSTEDTVENLVGVHPYGGYIIPKSVTDEVPIVVKLGETTYTGSVGIESTTEVGDTFTLTVE